MVCLLEINSFFLQKSCLSNHTLNLHQNIYINYIKRKNYINEFPTKLVWNSPFVRCSPGKSLHPPKILFQRTLSRNFSTQEIRWFNILRRYEISYKIYAKFQGTPNHIFYSFQTIFINKIFQKGLMTKN